MSAVINIDKVCRLCMEETPMLLPIFNEDSDHEGALLPQRIMALAEIQVNIKSLEGTVCEICWCYKKTIFFVYLPNTMTCVPKMMLLRNVGLTDQQHNSGIFQNVH
jgi:hypothetical protein